MKTLTPDQMDGVQDTPPVVLKVQGTPNGRVTFSVTPAGDEFVVATTPFEVIGAYEAHPNLSSALSRMFTCAHAVARDHFPPAATEQVAA